MYKPILFSLVLAAGVLSGGLYLFHETPPPAAVASSASPGMSPAADTNASGRRYMFNITLHTTEEIATLLTRAEQLAKTIPATDTRTGIALVLHGPEVEIFAKKNYDRYKELVDQAARLDADRVIEIKMCQTAMRDLGVKEEDVPGFVEFVPYGPGEIERLERAGYVYL